MQRADEVYANYVNALLDDEQSSRSRTTRISQLQNSDT